MKHFFYISILLLQNAALFGQDSLQLVLLPGEHWWGGLSADGGSMPYTENTHLERDQYGSNRGNQAQPLLLSNKGRFVWSEQALHYTFAGGRLKVTTETGELVTGRQGGSLKEVFSYVSRRFFPSDGELPDPLLFTHPQYNTWIELVYDQQQEAILEYARAIIDKGYPPGVLMIDDTWQEDYGNWTFSGARFDKPKMMMDSLHAMGFKVMLWVCPFVSPDSEIYRELAGKGLLILEGGRSTPQTAMIRWWNGVSAVLDLSNPDARDWFSARLTHLSEEYGVDGFKFDAGDADFYTGKLLTRQGGTPNDQTSYFAEVGLDYPLNEYRASWKMAGRPLVQRLMDKSHSWKDLQDLIPGVIAQGLMGYAYTCPDMIGGGQYLSFLDDAPIDEELVVRSAQVHALMPMMQFSVAPWRVLSEEHAEICRAMAVLHTEFGAVILEQAEAASSTGEPVARPLAYNYPGAGYEGLVDQFMIGTEWLVAPVTAKGVSSREVTFPAGAWRGDDGSLVTGPVVKTIEVPLERLPYFQRVRD